MSMEMETARLTFVAESRELLRAMEDALLRLEADAADREALNAVFRAAHTIKGSSGAFGLDGIVDFTHALESVLVEVRSGATPIGSALIGLLLACGDHLGGLVDAAARGEPADDAMASAGTKLVAGLSTYLPAAGAHAEPERQGSAAAARTWHVALRFSPDTLRNGLDPLAILRHLETLGTVESVAPSFDAMPAAEGMDPEACYLALELDVAGAVTRAELDGAFEFVRDDCDIRIEEVQTQAAADARGPMRESSAGEGSFVRVRADKLDELITLVGELVIAGAGTRLLGLRAGSSDLVESAAGLERLAQEVRDGALKLRMIPIAETFSRFKRVVRDLGHELGKEVELVLSGTDTEVDKSMAEKIADPLMHLVRNALDHGLEDRETRLARGKPATGMLHLNAYHDSGSIVIEVADDGAGLDRERIRSRAIERGMLAPGDEVRDEDLLRIVMEPGFSTAEAVTNVSGRGIGMDVVRRNVEALRGTIAIDSVAGEGTTISVRLPLTLAIIDGFVVGVGRAGYVIPLEMVLECIELAAVDRAAIRERGFINLRDEVLPLVRLREVFGVAGEAGRRENIVVVQCGGRRAGFVVDSLHGEFQTVIKPLGRLFERLSGISGSTILGNGEVGLILDVPALVQRAEQSDAARTSFAMKRQIAKGTQQ